MPDRISSQDRRLGRLGTLSEINARNTAAGATQTNNMMQQLMQMYQLAQSQEIDPLKAEALRLSNSEQQFKNDWAQPNAEAQYGLTTAQVEAMKMKQLQDQYQLDQSRTFDPLKAEALRLANQEQAFKNDWAQPNAEAQYNINSAQAQALQQRAGGVPTATDWLDYFGRMQMEVPHDFNSILPPEVQAARQAAVQKKQAEQQAALQQIEQQKLHPAPNTSQPLGQSIMNTPAVLLNGAASGLEYLAGSVGAKPDFGRMMGPGDIYYNYMMKGLEPPQSMMLPGPNTPATPPPPGPSMWDQLLEMLSKTSSPAMPAPRLP